MMEQLHGAVCGDQAFCNGWPFEPRLTAVGVVVGPKAGGAGPSLIVDDQR